MIKKIKLIHMSDSHVGLTRYSRVSDSGYNLRGEDFLESFRSVVDESVKLNPDIIIHSGDLFNSVVIGDRYIYEVQKILKKVTCPMILICGNHSKPKTLSAISPILLLDLMGNNFHVVVDGYEKIHINVGDCSVLIHAIPHIVDTKVFEKTLLGVKIDDSYDFNIATTHGALPFGSYLCMEEGHTIPQKFIDMDFDYVALGDYHETKKIHGRCYYSGGTDVFKRSENGEKGFLDILLEKSTNTNTITVSKKNIKNRECCFLKIDCAEKSIDDIYMEIETFVKNSNINDSVIFLDIFNVEPAIRDIMDKSHIKSLLRGCFCVHDRIILLNECKDTSYSEEYEMGDILSEWCNFLRDDKDLEQKKLGISYFEKIMENSLEV